ncbi:hypothetical protein [Clostridium sp.]|uniref:hypothetical protein n=1 Tax=Clostridium sp. TaxID=1506 RepID=UPI001A5E57BE|nr:hypothetical protein [Clostridium sp.]MBK5237158.1 hypothetical protein [Clostridium sp.]
MSRETYLWKMNVKTDCIKGVDPFEFCKTNSILGCGWRLKDKNGGRITPKDIEECEKLGRQQHNTRGFIVSIHALKEIEKDDLIWTRHRGIYYICRVTGKWRHDNRDANYDADVLNIIDVEFVEVGTIENVPGKVINSFRARSTIQRIHGYTENGESINPALVATMKIYNDKKKTNYYDVKPMIKKNILDMFLPEDVEEIISLYLQFEKKYLIYSSSNKIDTQTYEFVMTSRDGGHLCYAQVKTGNVSLDGDDYVHLTKKGNKVYLFTVSQKYYNTDNVNIIPLEKNEIIDFIFKNKVIMPQRINMWL